MAEKIDPWKILNLLGMLAIIILLYRYTEREVASDASIQTLSLLSEDIRDLRATNQETLNMTLEAVESVLADYEDRLALVEARLENLEFQANQLEDVLYSHLAYADSDYYGDERLGALFTRINNLETTMKDIVSMLP